MPYDGNPEIKESNGSKYLYMRKRVAGKLTSTYVDVYSDELYQLLLRNAKERKDLNKAIRKINKDLAALGYEDKELSARVLQNLDFARANLKANIYDQAVLEGVATTFPQTEDIIENGQVHGVSVIEGAGRLHSKECDGADTLQEEYARLGIAIDLPDENRMQIGRAHV